VHNFKHIFIWSAICDYIENGVDEQQYADCNEYNYVDDGNFHV
jgi:hypothetical protein